MTTPAHERPPRTLAVCCADWPVVAAGFAAGHPHPVAVLHANRVVATNPPARAAGVGVGMRRREAQGRCPDVTVVAHDPARDARRFEVVVAALATLTPRVEITEPGVAALATRGPSRYFGGDTALASRAAQVAADVLRTAPTDPPTRDPGGDDRGVGGDPIATVRVGVADGPLVARLAARRATATAPLVVPPGDAAPFLAPIPLRVLGPHVPDPEVLGTWLQLGLTTIGDVATLPAGSVLGRFGPDGMWVHRLAQGLDPRGLRPAAVPPDVTASVDLDPPATRSDAVAFAARTLAGDLVERLAADGLACTQVIVTLHTDHSESHERRWRLDGPARPVGGARPLAAAITDRVRWQVDGWLSGPGPTRPTAGVTRLVLAPGSVEPARGRQLGFWGGEGGADERVVRAVARLEALVGPDAVRVAEARGGRHPGEEVELVPTTAVDVSVARTVALPGLDDAGAPPWPGRLPAPSPTMLLDPPHEVALLDAHGRPVEVDGRGEIRHAPVSVEPGRDAGGAGGPRGAVVAWAGPWPVDERWWDPTTRCRHARLQVVTEDGTALLLSRRDRRWWLTARYG